MDERETDPPPWLPASRPEPPPPAPQRAGWGPPEPPKPAWRIDWRRFVRTPRAAVGFGLLAAGLLLWPFSGFSWIPLLIGLGALVVVRLLRFDGLLRGWDLPLAGLVAVVGLMWSTSPWAWAMAASLGVLIAGLFRLPAWRLVAVGLVLCVASGVGYGITSWQAVQQSAAVEAQAQEESQADQGAPRPASVLPILLNRIAQNVPDPVCRNLLDDQAQAAFAQAFSSPTCAAAVAAVAAQVADRTAYSRANAPTTRIDENTMTVDACRMTWNSPAAAGPQLGHLVVGLKAGGRSYVVVSYTPC